MPHVLCVLQEENGSSSNGDSTVMQNGRGEENGINGTDLHEDGMEERVEGLYKVRGWSSLENST